MIVDDCIDRIVGKPRKQSLSSVAVVLQGPYVRDHTRTCIEQFLLRNNSSSTVVIVSTYLPLDDSYDEMKFLSSFEKERIEEGVLVFIFVKIPSKEKWVHFWRTNQANQNLQRLTSFVGLRYAHEELGIEYSLKIRSDTFLGRINVLNYLKYEVEVQYPLLKEVASSSSMKGRLIVGGPGTFCEPFLHEQYPFYIQDHFYFGHTTDVMRFFDITTASGWNNGEGMEVSHPESSLTIRWMKDLKIDGTILTTQELLAKYFIIEDPDEIEKARQDPRGPNGCWWSFDFQRYLREGRSYIKESYELIYQGCNKPGINLSRARWEEIMRQTLLSHDTIIEGVLKSEMKKQYRAAVIIQGPYLRNYTRICIEEFLTRNPGILVIVSTYYREEEFLSEYEKTKIEEGVLVFLFVKIPSAALYPDFWRTNYMNQNLQRLTSYVGLRHAHDEYGVEFALKIRSDSFLGQLNIIEKLCEELQLFSTSSSRIVVTGNWTIIHPQNDWDKFHVRDHYYFGRVIDLMKFFDISPSSGWCGGGGMIIRSPESALTRRWMSDLDIRVKDIAELLQRFFVIHDPDYVELVRLDPREGQEAPCIADYSKYLAEGASYLKILYHRADSYFISTTRSEWEKLHDDSIHHCKR